MRHLSTLVGLLALVTLIAACGAPPTPVAYAEVCSQPDGSVVQTEGYIAIDGSIFCSNTGSSEMECGFELVDDPTERDGAITADIGEGGGNNKVAPIPEDFMLEDIVVSADDGTRVAVGDGEVAGDKVSLSGRMMIAENVCVMNVDKITRVP